MQTKHSKHSIESTSTAVEVLDSKIPKYKSLNSGSNHDFNKQRQDWNIEKWCRELKLSPKKLLSHPYTKDVRTLLDFDQYQHLMNEHDRAVWTHAWQWIYQKQLPMNTYLEKRLLAIVDGCNFRQARAEQQREYYQQQRALKKQVGAHLKRTGKGDHNDEAKGSQSADKVTSTILKAYG